MSIDKYIATFKPYYSNCKPDFRKIIFLESVSLKDSLLKYIFENLTDSWGDMERCGCWLTTTIRPQIVSLEKISEGESELVVPVEINLLELFGVKNIAEAYSTDDSDRCDPEDSNCDNFREEDCNEC